MDSFKPAGFKLCKYNVQGQHLWHIPEVKTIYLVLFLVKWAPVAEAIQSSKASADPLVLLRG